METLRFLDKRDAEELNDGDPTIDIEIVDELSITEEDLGGQRVPSQLFFVETEEGDEIILVEKESGVFETPRDWQTSPINEWEDIADAIEAGDVDNLIDFLEDLDTGGPLLELD